MTLCPCGTGKPYSNCCELLLTRKQVAQTPEELMRSRYTAYTKKNVDYIVKTTHPSKRRTGDEQGIRAWSKRATWLKLEVLNSRMIFGNEEGQVEFIAYTIELGTPQQYRERSTFKKEDGVWYYLRGEMPSNNMITKAVGRNESCPCGSGKKYKKCCGK